MSQQQGCSNGKGKKIFFFFVLFLHYLMPFAFFLLSLLSIYSRCLFFLTRFSFVFLLLHSYLTLLYFYISALPCSFMCFTTKHPKSVVLLLARLRAFFDPKAILLINPKYFCCTWYVTGPFLLHSPVPPEWAIWGKCGPCRWTWCLLLWAKKDSCYPCRFVETSYSFFVSSKHG